ncbi:MAG: hydrogenase 4 subunit F [Patescibacteria group bacterium]
MILALIIIIPLLIAAISAIIQKGTRLLEFLTVFSSGAVFFFSIIIADKVLADQSYSLLPYLKVSSFGAILLLLTSFISLIASLYSIGYLRTEVKKEVIGFSRVKQYFVLLNVFLTSMIFAISFTSPIMTWVAVEATTLSTAFLISFYNKPSSLEAAWKYLIINSVGLLLAFFGTILFMAGPMTHGGNIGLITWNELMTSANTLNPSVIKIAFVFILIGYGTKMGLVPMHTWLPDAHSKAPVPISSLLSGVLLNIALFTILRFKIAADGVVGINFSSNLFIYFGLFSILVSSLLIYLQTNYKRLLAYSTIEHMGIIALGIGFGSIGLFASILHMIYHSLAKPLLFLTSGNIFLKFSSTKIEKIKGVFQAIPLTGALFLIGIFAITGVPPFGIFMTEFSILAAGIQSHPIVAGFTLLGLVLIFIGFLKHASSMIFGEKPKDIAAGESNSWTTVPLILLATVLIFLSLYLPGPLKLLIERATLIF